MTENTLLLGAVAYDPKVVTIWDGFKTYFGRRGLNVDYVLYTNYERQVEALAAGHIHVAWNSPLAWLQSRQIASKLGRRAEAICMRDTDRDLASVIVSREGGPVRNVDELRGRRVAVGAKDSPQATLIPLYHLTQHGLEPNRDFEVLAFDRLVGKHGDHIGGEHDAARALFRSDCEAACLLDGNLLLFAQEGTLSAGSARILATTPPFDHCNFTMIESSMSKLVELFREILLKDVIRRSGRAGPARSGRPEAMAPRTDGRLRSAIESGRPFRVPRKSAALGHRAFGPTWAP